MGKVLMTCKVLLAGVIAINMVLCLYSNHVFPHFFSSGEDQDIVTSKKEFEVKPKLTMTRKEIPGKQQPDLENRQTDRKQENDVKPKLTVTKKSIPVMQKPDLENRKTNHQKEKKRKEKLIMTKKYIPEKQKSSPGQKVLLNRVHGNIPPNPGSIDTKAPPALVSHGTKPNKKYLLYFCHTHQLCGGWSDRQRGIVSIYILSLVTDRSFGVVMQAPCDMNEVYVPNKVNWIIPTEELKHKSRSTINDMGSRVKLSRRLMSMDFNEEKHQDVVYVKTNNKMYHAGLMKSKLYAPKLPTWARTEDESYVFARAWNTLMRPSPHLQQRLDAYLRSVDFQRRTRPLVCCHVRIGHSETMKNDAPARMNVSDVTVLWDFIEPYVKNGSRVFVATDNYEVRNMAWKKFGKSMSDTRGSIMHMDRPTSEQDACLGFRDAVLDQLILTKCDVLILTSSGFGRRAASIRGTNKDLFLFKNERVEKTTMK